MSVAIALLSTGCAAARMAVPADIVSASEELAITERSSWTGALADESFNLGPYKVVEVDREWNSKRTSSLGAIESTRSSGGSSQVYCSISAERALIFGKHHHATACRIAALSGCCADVTWHRRCIIIAAEVTS